MNKRKFVTIIKKHVRDSSFQDTLRLVADPPGRSPEKDLKELSTWYDSLDEINRSKVNAMCLRVLDSGIFGFFCVLDGVRVIEDYNKGTLILTYESEGERITLNDSAEGYLHDLYIADANK